MTTQADLERLAKCLELATSDNDHEALAALRKANQLRKRLGFTWTELLFRGTKPGVEPAQKPSGEFDVELAYELILANPDLNAWEEDFVFGSYSQFRQRGHLSAAQIKVLSQLYERHAFAARARGRSTA